MFKIKNIILLMTVCSVSFSSLASRDNIILPSQIKKETKTKINTLVSENGAVYSPSYSDSNPSKEDLIKLSNKNSHENNEEARYKILSDAAYTLGFSGGMAERSNTLIQCLNNRADKLDIIFNFSSLISQTNLLPPVVVEANELASFSTDQIRMANKIYKILIEEKFVSTPPQWSDYLLTGLTPDFNKLDENVPNLVKPENQKETVLWKKFIEKGWQDGIEQADNILDANFNRLTRDYVGMLRYSELLQTGVIKKGKTASSVQNLTGNQKEIILGDKLQRIIEKSSFELDVDKWRSSASPSYSNKIKKLK